MNKLFLRLFIFISLFRVLVANASQADFDQYFQQGLNTAAGHQQQSLSVLNQWKPEAIFKNYTASPDQSRYYNSVTQSNTTIKEDAVLQSTHNEIAKSIFKVDENQQQIDQQALQQEIARVSLIQDHAYNMVNGISDEFIDCTKQQSCTTLYEQKQCEEAPESILQYCKKTLNVDFIPHQEDTHYSLTAHLYVNTHNYAGVTIYVTNGIKGFLGPDDATFSLYGRLPDNIDCHTLQGKIISEKGDAKLDYIYFPSCANGLMLNFHISGGHTKDLQIDIVSSKVTQELKDHWDDGCLGLANSNLCTFQSEQCVQPLTTKVIQNMPVTRDCWEKESSYFCYTANVTDKTCAPLRNQGCEQINSVCEQPSEGGCLTYSRTYRCPVKQCENTGMLCNGQSYCLTGDCVSHLKQPDTDFQKAVSALSASMDAAKQFDQHFIFSGTPKSCRNLMLGAAYCCAEDGWLIDSHLISCNQEEKDLGNAKENGLSHYVGKYEEGCIADICVTKIKSYCVFPSKLARIVQEQGREKQLGRHFGSAKDPDCTGLTPEELQKIDFSQIDFKEFYDDIANNQSLEDQQKLEVRIQDEMKLMMVEGKPYHDKN